MSASNASLAMGLRLILPSIRSRIDRALEGQLSDQQRNELQAALTQIAELEALAARNLQSAAGPSDE